MRIDQISEDGIRRLVDDFYAKVRADPELAPIFNRAIPGDWGPHLATMRDFWSSVMLTSGRYKGNPVAVHLRIEGSSRSCSIAGWNSSTRRAANCSTRVSPTPFAPRPLRIAESLKLALFYRPDRPWPRSVP